MIICIFLIEPRNRAPEPRRHRTHHCPRKSFEYFTIKLSEVFNEGKVLHVCLLQKLTSDLDSGVMTFAVGASPVGGAGGHSSVQLAAIFATVAPVF
jgi:hypothetical protein